MATKVVVPELGESVVEGVVGKWHFKEGDHVDRDATLLEIETDKINLDIPCPATGTLAKIFVPDGTQVVVEQLLGLILSEGEAFDESMIAGSSGGAAASPVKTFGAAKPAPAAAPAAATATSAISDSSGDGARGRLSPAVRRLIEEHDINADEIPGTGDGGRIRK